MFNSMPRTQQLYCLNWFNYDLLFAVFNLLKISNLWRQAHFYWELSTLMIYKMIAPNKNGQGAHSLTNRLQLARVAFKLYQAQLDSTFQSLNTSTAIKIKYDNKFCDS